MTVAEKHKNCFICLLLVLVLTMGSLTTTIAQSYGLIFASHEVVPEQRTSLQLTPTEPICFAGKLDFSFEMGFQPGYGVHFGYVFRLINDKDQNIDFIYNEKERIFQLIAEESFTGINFIPDTNKLNNEWTKINFSLDADGNISCLLPGKTVQRKQIRLRSKCFRLLFGASYEHNFTSTDLPPMKIRNIAVNTDGNVKHFWPLDELTGTVADDNIAHLQAKVTNPVWLKPKYNDWQLEDTLLVKNGRPSIAFNEKGEILYIISDDSLYSMQAGNPGNITASAVPHAVLPRGNQSVYNSQTGQLYNFYPDKQQVREYNFTSKTWRGLVDSGLTEYWQANKFLSGSGNLYVFCGYGQLRYKNLIQQYNPVTKVWTIIKPLGDSLAPRYLSGLGVSTTHDTAYLIGGFGSKEGDQMLSPRHFYDLFQYDVKNNRLKKVYTLPEPQEQFVFANSIIADADRDSFYGLIYPNTKFNTHLQLIRGSLTKPGYTLLGNSFPYSFADTKSFVTLYFGKNSRQLLAVTMFLRADGATDIKIFRINFPPNEIIANTLAVNTATTPIPPGIWIIGVIAVAILILAALLLARYYNSKKHGAAVQDGIAVTETTASLLQEQLLTASVAEVEDAGISGNDEILPLTNTIQLFGNFEVTTAAGQTLTRQFTPLLKELFLLILIESLFHHKGVSAEKLTEVLWNGKDIKDANNNRSVNLAKLKSLLEKLGGCTVSRETGPWKFEFNQMMVDIDFADYLVIAGHKPEKLSNDQADKLLQLVKNGGFLQEAYYEWADGIKADISNFVILALLAYCGKLNMHTDAERIITACNAIFYFDEMNEHALKLKCKSLIALGRHAVAKASYSKFAVKYNEIYGQEFSETYGSLIAH